MSVITKPYGLVNTAVVHARGIFYRQARKMELGKYRGRLSNVRMRVNRHPMSSTVPRYLGPVTAPNPPTENGRSKKIIKAPKKFASKSRAAKPMAMPPIPPNAKTPETDTPNACSTSKVPVIATVARKACPPLMRWFDQGTYLRRFVNYVMLSIMRMNRSANHANNHTTATSRILSMY